jgi:hypothetical protein
VKDKFQDILSKVTKKSGRSRLEPYGELIDELRERGLTYRDISDILTAELQFQVPKSTVNDFVRERSRRRRNAALKARKPATEPATDGFHYNPDEPLRLIDPGKRDS